MLYIEKPEFVDAFRPGIDENPEWWKDFEARGDARIFTDDDGKPLSWTTAYYSVFNHAPQKHWRQDNLIGTWAVYTRLTGGNVTNIVVWDDIDFRDRYVTADNDGIAKAFEEYKANPRGYGE